MTEGHERQRGERDVNIKAERESKAWQRRRFWASIGGYPEGASGQPEWMPFCLLGLCLLSAVVAFPEKRGISSI